ncbi:MAG TPA: Gfo/Idh/MocA family oxidoreductase [Casimicrobiaceae bacterium]|nr:Gfo/Idh/MocA family oxidoreductase [Casimicrobiaceae bacterium]
MTQPSSPRRWGVVGLGRAFSLMLPTFVADARVQLCGAADPRAEARAQFEADFGAPTYASVDELCADRTIEVVYVASPHQMHLTHAISAASHGKHLLVEKPMALSVADCTRMIDAAAAAGVQLVVGHSHAYDAPIARTRALLDTGAFGAVRMIQAFYYTDYLYRPRRPEELRTAEGGGAVWNQAAHQVDIVRTLAGCRAARVRALTGNWDAARNTEGAYSALLTFEDGAFASLTYNGYGYFDSDEFCDWVGELGARKRSGVYGVARRALASAPDPAGELALKAARNYGGVSHRPAARADADDLQHQHFGTFIVSCDRADLRPLPRGVMIYEEAGAHLDALTSPIIPRVEVIDAVERAIASGIPARHDGRSARATLEVCAAMLESARRGSDVVLQHQVALPTPAQ